MPTTVAGIRFCHAMRCHLAWRGLGVRIAPTTRRFAADKAAPRLGTTFVAGCVERFSGPGATPALCARRFRLCVWTLDAEAAARRSRCYPRGCVSALNAAAECGDRTRTAAAAHEHTGEAVRGGHWSIPNHSRSQPAHSAMPAISERKTSRRIAPRMSISGDLPFCAHPARMQSVHLDRRESLGLGGAARADVSHSLRAEVAALRDHAHGHAAVAQVLNELLPCDVHGEDDARRAVARQAAWCCRSSG